jgi:hypothetical protein
MRALRCGMTRLADTSNRMTMQLCNPRRIDLSVCGIRRVDRARRVCMLRSAAHPAIELLRSVGAPCRASSKMKTD